jgi:hypothetical protein
MYADGSVAYMAGAKMAVLTPANTAAILAEPDAAPREIVVSGHATPPKVVPWGERNAFPSDLVDNVYKVPQMTSNLWFNIVASYGDGVKPVRILYQNGEQVIEPYSGNKEIDTFFEENDIQSYLLEQFTDIHWFFNVFPEIIFNKEDGNKRKIVELNSKEAVFSRWSEMDKKTFRSEYHYYYGYWGKYEPDEQDRICIATPVLDGRHPVRHLREIMEEDKSLPWDKRRNRFIVPVSFPTPGRSYYQKAYWFSLIESGWYDFAVKIPEFKSALMTNKIAVKYIASLAPGYFDEIFRREKITTEKDQLVRIKKEYADIKKFVRGAENAGSTIITFQKMDPKGTPYPMIKIETVGNGAKEGGDYIEDSEEVSNIISYGMLVHPSLVGASPGKNINISGTEARELFILKQALLKPFRDLILKPFYLIKAINQWPADLHFVIPNIELTTLDKSKTGNVTKINTL